MPDKGELQPKEKILIVFSIKQKDLPMYWEGEINCRIKWKTIHETVIDENESINKSIFNLKVDTLFIRIKKSPQITVK